MTKFQTYKDKTPEEIESDILTIVSEKDIEDTIVYNRSRYTKDS